MISYRVSFEIWEVLSSILFVFWYVTPFHKEFSGRYFLKVRIMI